MRYRPQPDEPYEQFHGHAAYNVEPSARGHGVATVGLGLLVDRARGDGLPGLPSWSHLPYSLDMAERVDFDTKLSPEGRVVVPAAVRTALGIGPGDRVRFVLEGGEVRLVTAQALLFAVWANNHGGDAGDSVADVRQERLDDLGRDGAKQARREALATAESRSEDEIEAALLSQLGLVR